MKALIQRVLNAKVTVNGEVVSNIEQGLCVLVGISKNDNLVDMEYIVRKILSIRLFNDDSDKRWSKSVVDKDFELLCVSQFTLYNSWKGNKPDFHNAMAGDESKKFYEQFLELLKTSYKSEKVKDGVFGAYMQVSIENDGPVTVEIESPVRDEKKLAKENSRNPQRAKPFGHGVVSTSLQVQVASAVHTKVLRELTNKILRQQEPVAVPRRMKRK